MFAKNENPTKNKEFSLKSQNDMDDEEHFSSEVCSSQRCNRRNIFRNKRSFSHVANSLLTSLVRFVQ